MSTLPGIELGTLQTNTHGDRYYSAVNPKAFVEAASSDVLRKHFGEKPFKEHTLHIICGTDSGLILKYIEKTKLPTGSRFIFIEYPNVTSNIDPDTLAVATDKEWIISDVDSITKDAISTDFEHYFFTNKLSLLQSVATADPTNKHYARLAHEAIQQINQLVLQLSSQVQNRLFLSQILRNAPESRIGIQALEGSFRGRTAVLLGGGPSLDDLLPWILEHRSQLDVLAVSRVSRRLAEVGLVPDFIFSIDPQASSLALGREMFDFWKHSLFVFSTHACSALVGQWRGRSIAFGPRYPWDDWSQTALGSTVTHVALGTAFRLGYGRVVFAGVDLCFGKDGYTHAKGSVDRDIGPNVMRGDLEVTTNSGELAETDRQMYRGIKDMETLVAMGAQQGGCSVVNPATSAARIEGVAHLPPDQIPLHPHPERAQDLFLRILPPDTKAFRLKDCKDQLHHLSEVRSQLEQIRRLARKGGKLNRKLFETRGATDHRGLIRKIEATQNKLKHTFPHLRGALIQLEAMKFIEILRPRKQTWDEGEIEDTGAKVFECYLDSSRELLQLVEHTEQRFRARVEEERGPGTDFDLLFDQWERDAHPGRALLWDDKHPAAVEDLPEPVSRRLEAFEAEYQAMVTVDAKIGIPTEEGFGNVIQKACACFQRGDHEGLERLASGLSTYEDEAARPVRNLVLGFQAELSDDRPTALERYRLAATDPESEAWEEALARTTACCFALGEVGIATGTLEQLSERNTAYTPQYANALRMSGRHKEAIDTYTEYLSKQPQDLETMVKLGELYRQLGIGEGAKMALDFVLQQNPDHPTARQRLSALPTAPET